MSSTAQGPAESSDFTYSDAEKHAQTVWLKKLEEE